MSPFALVVLAGGRATRMGGAPKPLLAFADGTTILARTLARLGPSAREVWLSATAETAPRLRLAVCLPVVLDAGRGPARALYAAAQAVTAPRLLLIGGDQPFVSLDVVEALARALDAAPDAGAAVATTARRCPIPGIYRRSAVLELPEAAVDDASLQWVLDTVGAVVIEGVPADALASVNTPAEARAAGLVSHGE